VPGVPDRIGSPTPTLCRDPGLITALLVAAFLLLAIVGLRHLSLTFDEPHHWRYGQNVLAGNSDRFDDSKMPVSAANALPGKIATWLTPGPLQDRLASPAAARLVTIAAAALLALLTFRWARELYGVGAGLFALALYAFDPNVIAHSRLITTDLYAALAVTATCYAFWHFCRRPGWRTGMPTAVALAASQVAKYFCVLLYPVLAVLALVYWAPTLADLARRRDVRGLVAAARQTAKWVVILVLVSLTLINAAFLFNGTLTPLAGYAFRSELFRGLQADLPSWLARLPLPLPYPYLEGLDWVVARERTGEGFGPNYLFGRVREGSGFLGYYLVAYLFKVPLAVQIAFGAALVLYVRRGRAKGFRQRELFLLGPVLLLWVYFNVFNRAQLGLRHIILTFPLMHVFTASLLGAPAVRPWWRRLVVGALLAWQAVSVLSYFPHELAYFNELILDRRQAYKVLSGSNIDWHQSEWYLARYLEAHPEAVVNPRQPVAGTVVVAVLGVTGVAARWGYDYRWLRHFEPVAHVAHAYLVYQISAEDLARALEERQER
jgi:4-amino-4-deoxy-L-arabinose transferase-like glycosyltransferase